MSNLPFQCKLNEYRRVLIDSKGQNPQCLSPVDYNYVESNN